MMIHCMFSVPAGGHPAFTVV